MGSATRLCCFRFVLLCWDLCCSLFFLASRLAHKAEHAVDLIGCRQMPVSLRDDSSLADPSLAFGALNRVLKWRALLSHCVNQRLLPQRGHTRRSPANVSSETEKREQFACAAASGLLALALGTVPLFCPKVRSRGITHKAESNSNCLGQATVVLVRWTFQPVAALIVRHVSSGDVDISGNSIHFSRKAAFGRMVSTCTRRRRAARWHGPLLPHPRPRSPAPLGPGSAGRVRRFFVRVIPRACARASIKVLSLRPHTTHPAWNYTIAPRLPGRKK